MVSAVITIKLSYPGKCLGGICLICGSGKEATFVFVDNKILEMKGKKPFLSLCYCFCLFSLPWLGSVSLVKLPLCLISSLLLCFPPSLPLPLPPSASLPTSLSSAPSREMEETRSLCLLD